MSAARSYRFGAPAHWSRCLTRGFSVGGAALVPMVAISRRVRPTIVTSPADRVAVDGYGHLFWRAAGTSLIGWIDDRDERVGPLTIDSVIGESRRIVGDKRNIWAFGDQEVRRYDRETLQQEGALDLEDLSYRHAPLEAIVDIAADGKGGVWLLADASAVQVLLHLDEPDCVADRVAVPKECGRAISLGVTRAYGVDMHRDTALVLLAEDKRRLIFVGGDGKVIRTRSLDKIHTPDQPADAATLIDLMATDGRDRIGLWCAAAHPARPVFLQLDGRGEPLFASNDLFGDETPEVADIGVGKGSAYFATTTGLWVLGGEADPESAAATSWLLTPVLMSPHTDLRKGWSRAELDLDLPPGAALEVSYASTNDIRVRDTAARLAADDSLTVRERFERIWIVLEGDEATGATTRTFTIEGTRDDEAPIAIPLFETKDQWLWLRLRLDVPASSDPPKVKELRVIYPEVTLMSQLPLMYAGERHDPEGTLRRLVGVLETSVQSIDRSIEGIGRLLQADTAPKPWLDYLGGWLDLPWHEALPEDAKRRLIAAAAAIIGERGTRRGLVALLQALLGPRARIEIADLTVDHAPMRLSGGAALPALIGGRPSETSRLGRKARLGRLQMPCAPGQPDPQNDNPFATIVPTLRIELTAPVKTRQAIGPLLATILEQFVPLGVRTLVAWTVVSDAAFDAEGEEILTDMQPGRTGEDVFVGGTILGGRLGRIGETGMDMGTELR